MDPAWNQLLWVRRPVCWHPMKMQRVQRQRLKRRTGQWEAFLNLTLNFKHHFSSNLDGLNRISHKTFCLSYYGGVPKVTHDRG